MKYLALAFLFLSSAALADNVYVCKNTAAQKYFDCGDTQTVIVNKIEPTDLVFVTPGTGQYCIGDKQSFWYCDAGRWKAAKDLTDASYVGICAGMETTLNKCAAGLGGNSGVVQKTSVQGVTWVSEWKFSGYTCYPSGFDEVRKDIVGNAGALVWYCDKPDRIQPHHFTGDPKNIPHSVFGLAWKAIVALFKPNRQSTPEELAVVDKIMAEQGVKITVAASTSGTRPVYAATATNTKGADTKKDVAVGSACGWKRLQDAYGKATNYFSVEGGFALCTVSGVVSK